jgi:hypothetical protein
MSQDLAEGDFGFLANEDINTEVGRKTCRFSERDARTTDAGNDFTILTHICR